MPYELPKKNLELLNTHLKELPEIKADLERAKAAGVPNLENIEQRVQWCDERCRKLKANYFPKSK